MVHAYAHEEGGSEGSWLLEEGEDLRTIRGAADQARGGVAVSLGYEEEKDFQGANGGFAEDEPVAGRPDPRSEMRHHAVEFAASGGLGRQAGCHRLGLGPKVKDLNTEVTEFHGGILLGRANDLT